MRSGEDGQPLPALHSPSTPLSTLYVTTIISVKYLQEAARYARL